MSAPKLHDLDRINEALASRIDELVERMFPNADKVGGYYYLGGLDGRPGTKLAIWRTGAKRGEWCDFAAGHGGRPLGLVIASRYGGDGDAGRGIRWAADWLGMGVDETPEQKRQREDEAAKQRAAHARAEAENAAKRGRAAQAIFLEGAAVLGTPAEVYLRDERNIDLRTLSRQPGAFRFHGELACPETARRRIGLLAAVAGEHGFMTVHRTFLHALANGRVVKADDKRVPEEERMRKAKQTYSARKGGLISVWRGDSGKRLRDMPAGEWIALTEGIEDALSIAIADPSMRVGCVVALDGLSTCWLPGQVGGVYWHRHRGDGEIATAKALKEMAAVAARGLAIREVWAPEGFKDFNAWLQAQREGLRA